MGFWAQEPHAHTPPHLPRFPNGFGSNPLQAGLWLPSQREKCLFPLLLPSPPLPAGQLTATRTPLREAPPPLGHSLGTGSCDLGSGVSTSRLMVKTTDRIVFQQDHGRVWERGAGARDWAWTLREDKEPVRRWVGSGTRRALCKIELSLAPGELKHPPAAKANTSDQGLGNKGSLPSPEADAHAAHHPFYVLLSHSSQQNQPRPLKQGSASCGPAARSCSPGGGEPGRSGAAEGRLALRAQAALPPSSPSVKEGRKKRVFINSSSPS